MCVIIVRRSIMIGKEKRVCSCESNCPQLQEGVANIVDLEKQYLIVSKWIMKISIAHNSIKAYFKINK